jgi:subtilisin family serine protease
LLLAAALLAAPIAMTPATAQPHGWAKGRILVQPTAGLSEEALADILGRRGGRSVSHNQRINVHIVAVPPKAEWAIAQALSKNPLIQFAEPDTLVEPMGMVADDPQFADEWHLEKIQAPTAWEVSTGGGVTVAILDTGVEADHPDLASRLVPGWNAVDLDDDTTPVNSHGTRVAGVVAAETNNGVGVASIAYGAHLMPIRVSNSSDGVAYESDIARGLTWAADHGAQVANISYDVTNSAAVSAAAQYMRSKGGVVVAAAGNHGTNTAQGDNPYVISVSPTTSWDSKASYPGYGDAVDVSAPGYRLLSTTTGGGYATVSGTSYASATTAGVAALLMSANKFLSPEDVESILESTAVDLGVRHWDPGFGFGRVDAGAAVQLAADMAPSDTEAPVASIVSPTTGSTLSGLVPVAISADDDVGISHVELYADQLLVGTDLTAPYEFSWDSRTPGDGTVTLTARAFDAAGNQGHATLTVTVDNTAPEVTILGPADGASVRGRVTLAARASDDVALASLAIAVDGQTMCAGDDATVSCDWKPGNLRGDHTISARAEDGAGNVASTTISIHLTGNAGGVDVRAGEVASNESDRRHTH